MRPQVCVIVFLAIYATTFATSDLAKDDPLCEFNGDGNFQNPEDCSTYFNCTDGNLSLESCPPGLEFNSQTGSCDDPEIAQCEESGVTRSTTTTSTTTTTRPTWGGTSDITIGPQTSTVAWTTIRTTTWPTSTTTSGGHLPTCHEIGELLPNPCNCSTFYECNGALYPVLLECPDGLEFNAEHTRCEYPNDANCQEQPCRILQKAKRILKKKDAIPQVKHNLKKKETIPQAKHNLKKEETIPQAKHILKKKETIPQAKHILKKKETIPKAKDILKKKETIPQAKHILKKKETIPEAKHILKKKETILQAKHILKKKETIPQSAVPLIMQHFHKKSEEQKFKKRHHTTNPDYRTLLRDKIALKEALERKSQRQRAEQLLETLGELRHNPKLQQAVARDYYISPETLKRTNEHYAHKKQHN